MVNENIKKARESAKISQRELGRRIDKTGQYISYLEKNSKANPSIIVLSDIATALNVPLSQLIDEQETLTNKLIKSLEIVFNTDAENTLELICELIDIDPEVIDVALKENNDISESYLSRMLTIICKNDPIRFYNLYNENKDLISENYLICFETCNKLLSDKVNDFQNIIEKTYNYPKIKEAFKFITASKNLNSEFDSLTNEQIDELRMVISEYIEFQISRILKHK